MNNSTTRSLNVMAFPRTIRLLACSLGSVTRTKRRVIQAEAVFEFRCIMKHEDRKIEGYLSAYVQGWRQKERSTDA